MIIGKKVLFVISLINVSICCSHATSKPWTPVENSMLTQWGENLKTDKVWTEYPRPQLQRKEWTNLNGLWDYAVTAKNAEKPASWDGEILVPFAIEAPLSGVGKLLKPVEALWYRRTFKLPSKPKGQLHLHFEAVDYEAHIWINGTKVGSHRGGNLPFTFDIVDYVNVGENELVLQVFDATSGFQLKGKQSLEPKGIWYTRVSGIWQTVWLEPVSERYISDLRIDTDIQGSITVKSVLAGTPISDESVMVTALFDGSVVASGTGQEVVKVSISNPKLWLPSSPNLYDLKVDLLDKNQKVVDSVTSYAGIRKVGKTKDADDNWRFTLNDKIIFHWGTLDQGWWPDGLLTPPSEEAMVSDIHFLKDAGFNVIRKHIKVEPRRYYYECDRLGMMVWQDQVSGGRNPKWKRLDSEGPFDYPLDAEWPEDAHTQWMTEFRGMIDHLYNNPSIVVWSPFNEGWGQHRTMEVGKWAVGYDLSRLINIASGGNFFPVGDICANHRYPDPSFNLAEPAYADYVKVIGEFGGHGWQVQDHLGDKNKRYWAYGGFPSKTKEEYIGRYQESIDLLSELKKRGIAAGIYTQTTDVEGEINGLITYDRKVIKISAKKLDEIQKKAGITD